MSSAPRWGQPLRLRGPPQGLGAGPREAGPGRAATESAIAASRTRLYADHCDCDCDYRRCYYYSYYYDYYHYDYYSLRTRND